MLHVEFCFFSIDATHSGGYGRLVNDSIVKRKANTVVKEVVNGGSSHLCLFVAGGDILAGQEITYFYGPTDTYMYWRKVTFYFFVCALLETGCNCLKYCFKKQLLQIILNGNWKRGIFGWCPTHASLKTQ